MADPARDEEAWVVKVTETVSTLALLNLYWLISSLLIVPAFAATEALFHCVHEHVENRRSGLGREFFSYVKTNLISSFKRQIIPILVLLLVLLDTVVIYFMPSDSLLKSVGLGMFLIISILIYFIFMYQLAILFSDTKKEALKWRALQSFYTVLSYPQYTGALVLILITYVLLSLYFVPLFFFFGLSFPAYCFTYVLRNKVNQKSHRM